MTNMSSSISPACRHTIELGNTTGAVYSLPALERATGAKLSRLPISLRVVLESLLRNCDGRMITEAQVRELANWQPNGKRESEIPFVVGRVVLNCAAGIEPNHARLKENLEKSLMLVTALNPHIGYEKAAAVAKEAFKSGKTIRQLCLDEKILPEDQLTKALDPLSMTEPHG